MTVLKSKTALPFDGGQTRPASEQAPVSLFNDPRVHFMRNVLDRQSAGEDVHD
jgi:hypothetical protein